MPMAKTFRKCYSFILFSIFSYVTFDSINRLMSYETTISMIYELGEVPMPSITMCPNRVTANYPMFEYFIDPLKYHLHMVNPNQTLLEFNDTVPSLIDSIIEAKFVAGNEYGIWTWSLDLMDNNATFDETVKVNSEKMDMMFNLVKCLTINAVNKTFKTDKHYMIHITLNMTLMEEVIVFMHEENQYNNILLQYGMSKHVETGSVLTDILDIKKRSQLNYYDHVCDEYSLLRTQLCVTGYLEDSMNCTLPWKNSTPDSNLCNDPFEYVYLTLESATSFDNLTEFGCLGRNCEEYSWKVLKSIRETIDDNVAVISMVFLKGSNVEVTKEVFAYQFANFVADFGGYLGLCLGASLLSIYDYVLFEMKFPSFTDFF